MAKEKRKRNWVLIVYSESAPLNWRELLRSWLIPGYISPLHCDDYNADGEVKKPHYHVVLTFKGLKSYEQVKELTDALNAPAPQPCKDLRAYCRYLCHLDNPEKAQYDINEVECLCGTDYLEKIKSLADTDSVIGEMMDWCVENQCSSFFRLSQYARENRSDWFRVVSSQRTVFLVAWLKSYEWEKNKQQSDTVEKDVFCCSECGSVDIKKNGKVQVKDGFKQRFVCKECGQSWCN